MKMMLITIIIIIIIIIIIAVDKHILKNRSKSTCNRST
jgi:ABC-type bacteriocin/lantibiotic exporter with double-glycine peptidase domain